MKKLSNIVQQSVGIDCGKDHHALTISVKDHQNQQRIVERFNFRNYHREHEKMLRKVRRCLSSEVEPLFVMEATGVYHEALANYLYQQGCKVSVVLPSRAKYYAKTFTHKSSNDRISADILSYMGLEKQLESWTPPHPIYLQLRHLTRERAQLNDILNVEKNRMHAEEYRYYQDKESIQRMKKRIQLIERQIDTIDKQIKEVLNKDEGIKKKVERLRSIPGVKDITIAIILGETNGFQLIKNARQLVSYAGLDVVHKVSGTSIQIKGEISKRGNAYIRGGLFMPTMSAIQHCPTLKTFYERLVNKGKSKMTALIAAERKLLELIYYLWRYDREYDAGYEEKKNKGKAGNKAIEIREEERINH